MPRYSPWQKFTSQRSGFDTKRIAVISDRGVLVDPSEFDEPPPSSRPLGGEGSIARGQMRVPYEGLIATDTAVGLGNPTVYISAAGITATFTNPFMLVTGSNEAVTITANPRITSATQDAILTLWCVDSGITLQNGNGLAMMGSSTFNMTSGSVISFIFNTGATASTNVWQETSRSRTY